MKHPIRDVLNRRRFRQAKAEAETAGHMVCATITGKGKPVYFTLPRGADDKIGEAKAFELKYGRPITEGEQMLKLAAAARAAKANA